MRASKCTDYEENLKVVSLLPALIQTHPDIQTKKRPLIALAGLVEGKGVVGGGEERTGHAGSLLDRCRRKGNLEFIAPGRQWRRSVVLHSVDNSSVSPPHHAVLTPR
ncbi:hypothetical protein J6590_039101 [Homalodisca vitripennis]|nr:hypothetical protein J6590_039101 [Homalodisca vitripennis]